MRAAFSKPVFDREKCIAIIPARIADTKTAHIFYGSAVLTLLGLVPALFEYQNYFSVFMIGAFIFVSIFFISIFVRNHTRRNPEIMIDNAGVIFSGLIGKNFLNGRIYLRLNKVICQYFYTAEPSVLF